MEKKETGKTADWNVLIRVRDEDYHYVELTLAEFIPLLLGTLGLELKSSPSHKLIKKKGD